MAMQDYLIMATEQDLFNTVLHGFQLISVFVFCALFVVGSPYGSQTSYTGIFAINGRAAWIVMELVSPLALMYSYFVQDPVSVFPGELLPIAQQGVSEGSTVLIYLWVVHYLNRAIVYPLRQPCRKSMHVGIMLCACAFNIVNGYLNGRWLATAGHETAPSVWGWRFVLGVMLFVAGFAGNIHHDNILMRLRSKPNGKTSGSSTFEPDATDASSKNKPKGSGSSKYSVPHGSLFTLVSCPHFLCEIVEWTGFAVASGSPAAWTFVLNVLCNLAPRAYFIHKWYAHTFPTYPRSRKAMVPFVF
ncbi:hypothetical protein IW140_001955 [Coemansia sp. RSA 1813]|nr:hypothetical protein EV178_001561 [Coemansia sp. RSA 1646]KAJ1771626.1 hypothetical protein LPJ74_002181 [Coemansia sp. RSA 1843]KAJ2089928.1 hypothetical protein IW138_003058 [Coemansia sp. RSA 986]KAJ2215244.1 hypothetical protein EV179_002332 [Coemansia sp. RSA 487]KAJ2571001.1 hypothetical protein IW140_001955 [Coemansia sp. RSA 1813]